jgi:hypothetical protein
MSDMSRHDPALELLRDLDPKVTLSPEAKRRIAAHIENSVARSWSRWLWAAAPCAAALALFLVRTTRHPQATQSDGTQAFVVPACAVSRVADGDRFAAALVGPADAEVGGVKRQSMVLHSGRLIVHAKQQSVEVVGPDARVTVAPSSVAEIEVRDLHMVRVAVYSGRASVEVTSMKSTLAIPVGSTWTGGDVHLTEPRDSEQARQILEPATGPAQLCPAPATGAPTAMPSAEPVLPPAIHRVREPRPSHAEVVAAPIATPSPASNGSPATEEARELADAIHSLRTDHDPRSALALLDALPRGTTFADEIALVRVEALLALGNRSGALATLDAMSLPDLPRGEDLLVLRGDLRAEAKRWPDAINDYTRGMASSTPDLAERSQFRRAQCRMAMGETTLGSSELRAYLQRFPRGAFVKDALRLLSR